LEGSTPARVLFTHSIARHSFSGMKPRKRKRAEDDGQGQVNVDDVERTSEIKQDHDLATLEDFAPEVNISTTILAQINIAFTASTLAQQPLIDGNTAHIFVPDNYRSSKTVR